MVHKSQFLLQEKSEGGTEKERKRKREEETKLELLLARPLSNFHRTCRVNRMLLRTSYITTIYSLFLRKSAVRSLECNTTKLLRVNYRYRGFDQKRVAGIAQLNSHCSLQFVINYDVEYDGR